MKKSLLLLFSLIISATLFAQDYDCPIPQNLKAKVELNNPEFNKKYKVICTWDAIENVDGYAVYVSTQYYPEGYWMGNVAGTEFIMGSDVDGQMYIFVATICDAENEILSDYSEEVSVILSEEEVEDFNAINAPANLTATAKSSSSIELTWDAVENANSYFVYCNDEEIANITSTSYVVEGLECNTEYCYTVTAMGVDTESDPSEEACTKTLGESLIEGNKFFKVFPNPVSDNITVYTNLEISEVNIYNVLGVNVYNETSAMNNSRLDINVSDFNEGVYFIKIKTEVRIIVKRFIKK